MLVQCEHRGPSVCFLGILEPASHARCEPSSTVIFGQHFKLEPQTYFKSEAFLLLMQLVSVI